jgi:hypothetical protein
MLDSAGVSKADLLKSKKAICVTCSYKFPITSGTPGNQSFVASLYAGLGNNPVQFFFDIASASLGVFASLDRF